MTNRQSLPNFIPAPGYILVEDIKQEGSIVKSEKNNDEPEIRQANVLGVGDETLNQFGTLLKPPCKVGDKIIYRHVYGNDEFELDYFKYPIVAFDMFRGKIE